VCTISSKDVFRPDRIWPFRFAYQLLYFKDNIHIFNFVKDMSPDGNGKPCKIDLYFFIAIKERPEEAPFIS
jgi:hypothetical protein